MYSLKMQGNLIKIRKKPRKARVFFISAQIIEVSHCAERSDKAIQEPQT